MATLSKRSVETLIDLVEIKLSCLQVFDRDDAKELATLEHALKELESILPKPSQPNLVTFPGTEARQAAG
jgi:hypothetical protein